jgi:hypothetical protein
MPQTGQPVLAEPEFELQTRESQSEKQDDPAH